VLSSANSKANSRYEPLDEMFTFSPAPGSKQYEFDASFSGSAHKSRARRSSVGTVGTSYASLTPTPVQTTKEAFFATMTPISPADNLNDSTASALSFEDSPSPVVRGRRPARHSSIASYVGDTTGMADVTDVTDVSLDLSRTNVSLDLSESVVDEDIYARVRASPHVSARKPRRPSSEQKQKEKSQQRQEREEKPQKQRQEKQDKPQKKSESQKRQIVHENDITQEDIADIDIDDLGFGGDSDGELEEAAADQDASLDMSTVSAVSIVPSTQIKLMRRQSLKTPYDRDTNARRKQYGKCTRGLLEEAADSGLLLELEAEEEHLEGRRRGTRVRMKPLDAWRNQRVIYERRNSGVVPLT
jgi:hypothetical protein